MVSSPVSVDISNASKKIARCDNLPKLFVKGKERIIQVHRPSNLRSCIQRKFAFLHMFETLQQINKFVINFSLEWW